MATHGSEELPPGSAPTTRRAPVRPRRTCFGHRHHLNGSRQRLGAGPRAGVRSYPLTPAARVSAKCRCAAGVNLVMYTLTGNYKSDQVHVPICCNGWGSEGAP